MYWGITVTEKGVCTYVLDMRYRGVLLGRKGRGHSQCRICRQWIAVYVNLRFQVDLWRKEGALLVLGER
jgi:hypothetical protein